MKNFIMIQLQDFEPLWLLLRFFDDLSCTLVALHSRIQDVSRLRCQAMPNVIPSWHVGGSDGHIAWCSRRVLFHGRWVFLRRRSCLYSKDFHPKLLGTLHQKQSPFPAVLPRSLVFQSTPPRRGLLPVCRLNPCIAGCILRYQPSNQPIESFYKFSITLKLIF